MSKQAIPAWLRGCKIAQFLNKDGIYSTYVVVGKQLIAISFSDNKNAWIMHTRYVAKSFAQLVREGIPWSLEDLTRIAHRKFVRSMML